MALSIGELVGYVTLDTGEVSSGVEKVKGLLGGAADGWGKLLGGAGLAAGGAYATTLVGAMNVEKGTDRLAAALGAGTKEADRLGGVAGDLYAGAWGDSLEDVNGAVEAVYTSIGGMADASSQELHDTTAMAMDFANAMQVDVARAAQVAGQMVSTGLADNATEAFDLLTAASSKVPAALREDVLDAVDEYGQFFDSVGIGGEQAMSMLVAASEKGMYGIDKTGDAIKEFTIRSTDMSQATKGAYESIGLSAKDMTDKLLAGGDTAGKATQQIIDGILGIKDPAAQSQAALALFGTPLEDLNTQEIPAFLKSLKGGTDALGEVDGAAARMGQTLNDNAMTNLTSFGRQLKQQAIGLLGGQLLPIANQVTSVMATQLGPAIDTAAAAFSAMGGFISQHSTAFQVLAGILVAALVPSLILMGVEATRSAIKTVAAFVMERVAAIQTVAAFVIAKTTMVAGWVLMGAQALLGAAKVAAAWLIAMGPIALVIAAVVGLVVLIVKNWDTIKAVTVKVWSAIVAWLGKAWDTIKAAAVAVWDAIKAAISTAVGAIKGVITSGLNAAKAAAQAVWDAIKTAASAVWSAIKAVIAREVAGIKATIGLLASIPGKVGEFFGRAKDAAVDKLQALVSWLSGLPGRILSAIGDLGSLLFGVGKSILQGLIDGVMSMLGTLKDKLGSVTKLIPDWKGPMQVDAKLLAPNGEAIMRSLVDGFQAGVPVVRSALQGLTGDLSGMVGQPAMAGPAGGSDFDRLAAAVSGRSNDRELVDAVNGLRSDLRRLPRDYRLGERKGVKP